VSGLDVGGDGNADYIDEDINWDGTNGNTRDMDTPDIGCSNVMSIISTSQPAAITGIGVSAS